MNLAGPWSLERIRALNEVELANHAEAMAKAQADELAWALGRTWTATDRNGRPSPIREDVFGLLTYVRPGASEEPEATEARVTRLVRVLHGSAVEPHPKALQSGWWDSDPLGGLCRAALVFANLDRGADVPVTDLAEVIGRRVATIRETKGVTVSAGHFCAADARSVLSVYGVSR